MKKLTAFQRIALILVIIGALNWGLIGFFNFDFIAGAFGGQDTALARILYGIVGLSGLVVIPLLFERANNVTDDDYLDANHTLKYGTEFSEDKSLTGENTVENNREDI